MRIMNRVTMFIWGLIVFSIWGVILFLGFKNQDKEYINLTNDLKKATTQYLKKNNIRLKFNETYKVYVDDLVSEEYIDEEDKLEEYCIDSVAVSKGLILNDYEFNKECKE